MSSSDFCIRCDRELSAYCEHCFDAMRDRLIALKTWATSRIAHCNEIEEKYQKTHRYDIPLDPVEARQERRTLEAVLRMLDGKETGND